jgi:hypothetical protein
MRRAKPGLIKKVEKELLQAGGQLEWACEHGVGVSFASITDGEIFGEIPVTIRSAVWIGLDHTGVTDSALTLLEDAQVLEDIGLTRTRVTAPGIHRLLAAVPTLQRVTISLGQFTTDEKKGIRSAWPHTELAELRAGDAPHLRRIVD